MGVTNMTEQAIKKPTDRLKVSFGLSPDLPNIERELFMSAGLLRKLATVTSGHASMVDLYTDASMQSFLIVEVLKPRTPRGEAVTEYQLEDFDISIEEAEKVSNWIIEHIVSFFLNAVQKVRTAVEDKDSNLMKLAVSMNGSQDSTIENPSVGVTDANSVT